jgi:DNA polymerase III epsilon subunit-like protein
MDTETTGLYPVDSGPFEIAILIYEGGIFKEERLFHLNPLVEGEVIIHQEALDVNGATEDQIRSYPPAKEVVPDMVELFKKYAPPEKLAFLAYNCPFDYGHLGSLLFREGFLVSDYFNGRFIDVLEMVKKARKMKLIDMDPKENNKLETVTKNLGIPHEDSHTALSDIKATRWLYETIWMLEKGIKR